MSLLLRALPLVFFGALLFSHLVEPSFLVFDEIHYIPAAKSIGAGMKDLNWVHPPMAKYLLALGWLIFTKILGVLGEPTVFRFVASLFGLWMLWSVRAWTRALGYSEAAAQAAMWLTGFNFLWFVQSKTAMLDVFYAAFAMWGLLDIHQHARHGAHPARWWRGWIYLGISMSCKWAAAPFFVLALFLAAGPKADRVLGGLVSFGVYLLTFVPVLLLKNEGPAPGNLVEYHRAMFGGMEQIATAPHPYLSHWWQWPTLLRPMWYTFENANPGERCIWAGGNPVLYLAVLPLLVFIAWQALGTEPERPGGRRAANGFDPVARKLALLYWIPLLFWAVAPRKLQLYYYYLVPSLWLGPIVVWAHERYRAKLRDQRGWLLFGFVLLAGAAFIYFLPIMDGRVLAPGLFRRYMWLRNWI